MPSCTFPLKTAITLPYTKFAMQIECFKLKRDSMCVNHNKPAIMAKVAN